MSGKDEKEKVETTASENLEEETITQEAEVEENTDDEQKPKDDSEEKYRIMEDKYLRLLAEYDNYQKRTAREKDSRYADAVIDTAEKFLPVLDDLSRALEIEVSGEEAKKIKDGVLMVSKKMKDALDKLGITEITAVGEEFDPNIHNAIQHVEDDTVTDNTIVEEYMKGYVYKDGRVVRHSVVKVAN